jgi:hypothetical protein
MEIEAGKVEAARPRLLALAKDAVAGEFPLIARKASAAAKTLSPRLERKAGE